jgi:hypothetical protein
MRSLILALTIACLSLGIAVETQAEDQFMRLCTATTDQKTCRCMSTKVPREDRAAAIAGLREFNAAIASVTPQDPSSLSSEQMRGLGAVVLAQASCM